MKRMNFVWGVLIAAFVLLLSACRSTKNITQTEPQGEGSAVEWVDKMALSGLKEGTVTSKMKADYCFCLVFCCTGSSRLSRLLIRPCILLHWQ